VNIFSDSIHFKNLVKRENIALVSLTNAYNSTGLITLKKKLVHKRKLRLALYLAYV